MSRYGTEFELSDADGDEFYINRDVNDAWPLMFHMRTEGVELYREDVEALFTYLGTVLDKVPARPVPQPAPEPPIQWEYAGGISDGRIVWEITRPVCNNTFNINHEGSL